MDLAKCALDDNVYTAAEFSEFPQETRQTLGRRLICNECEQEAYFRRASRDGKKACFYSRKHLDGCWERHVSGITSQKERENLEIVIELIKSSKTIVLDFSQNEIGDNSTANTSQHNGHNSYSDPSKAYIGQPAETCFHTCCLARFLIYLITSKSFAKSDLLVRIDSDTWEMKNLLVQFNEIEEFHVGEMRGYWGMITDADASKKYLNSGGRDDVSILLDPDIRKGIVNKYGIGSSEDFAGCYALVFGELKKSKKGKKYILPYGISRISLNMPTTEEIVEDFTTYSMEDSNSVPVGEDPIHSNNGSGEVCQVDSTHQRDMESFDTVSHEAYETSHTEDTDVQSISRESSSAAKDIAHPQDLPENCTTSEHLKRSPRWRITEWLKEIILKYY